MSGTSSWQSLAAAANFLDDRQITEVLLVSDPFHSLRIRAMASELGLDGSEIGVGKGTAISRGV